MNLLEIFYSMMNLNYHNLKLLISQQQNKQFADMNFIIKKTKDTREMLADKGYCYHFFADITETATFFHRNINDNGNGDSICIQSPKDKQLLNSLMHFLNYFVDIGLQNNSKIKPKQLQKKLLY